MSRTERLLDLLQILHRHRRPVGGPALAAELGISLRTLYRDIATLQGQGARIEGAPGLGYVLEPGFVLPPLMFSEDEIEALILGSRWVARRGDERLGAAAENAIAKIADVLPADLRVRLDTSTLLVGPRVRPRRALSAPAQRPHEGMARGASRRCPGHCCRKLTAPPARWPRTRAKRMPWPIARKPSRRS